MPIYWSFLFLSYFLLLFKYNKTKVRYVKNNNEIYFVPKSIVIFPVLYIALFVCLRDEVLDTYYYIGDFKNMPTTWEAIQNYTEYSGSQGFHKMMGFFKMYISDNYYLWLTFIAFISLCPLFYFYKRHSCNFAFTFFLFVSSTTFTWLLNGARQFIAVCILVGLIDLFLSGSKKLKILYILIGLTLTTIHSSVWFVLPMIYVCSCGKVLNKRMLLVVVATVVGTMLMGDIMNMASEVMNKDYDISESTGSSVIRLLVSSVPLFLVLFKLSNIKSEASPFMSFVINMSLVGVCFYFASTFSSGILVGRMPIYFTIYNFILIPWLLKKYYKNTIFTIFCILGYTFFFYYQMCIAWSHLDYKSIALGIQFFRY